MTFSAVVLVSIIFYEVFRLFTFESYTKTLNQLKRFKGVKDDSERKFIASEVVKEGFHFKYIVFEIIYTVVLFILLFTQYWLVALLIILQSLVLSTIVYKGKDRSFDSSIADSIITIVIIIIGLASI